MEWLETLYSLAVGLVLRFALPLALTALIIIWLRWLDARWQREAGEILKGTGMVSFWDRKTPCWDAKGCTPEMRASCPVFRDGRTACWQLRRTSGGQLQEECLVCEVFLNTPAAAPA
jgi:hypothetical protein